MNGLILHAGANAVPFERLLELPTKEPEYRGEKGKRMFYPVRHAELVTTVKGILQGAGAKIVEEAHALNKQDAHYFGLLRLESSHPTWGEVIGLRNADDGLFKSSLAMGSGVFVCDNLSFNGEITVARKHTRWIHRDFPSLVAQAIGKLNDFRALQEKRIQVYHDCPLPETSAESLILRAYLADVYPERLIKHVHAEWRRPRHPDFEPRTVWSFFNAVTECLKPGVDKDGQPERTNLNTLSDRTQRLHGLLDAQVALTR